MNVPDSKSRRDWILLAGRVAAAAALGFGGALLLRRSCPDGSCSACPEQGGCRKPDAAAFRKQVHRQSKDGGRKP
jgi:hypothetical protein